MVLTAGYFVVEAASVAMSILKFAIACAPKLVNAVAAEVAPVPPFATATVPVTFAAVPVVF